MKTSEVEKRNGQAFAASPGSASLREYLARGIREARRTIRDNKGPNGWDEMATFAMGWRAALVSLAEKLIAQKKATPNDGLEPIGTVERKKSMSLKTDIESCKIVNKQPGVVPIGSKDLLCRACGAAADEVRNINLYVIGSEGLNVCHDCEMQIVEFCRSMIRTATKARMAGYRACKQVADAKRDSDQDQLPRRERSEPIQKANEL